MKKFNLLLGSTLMLCSQLLNAQDIFKQHGFTKEPLTLSNGNYNEFFNNDEIVQVGTVLLNTKTNKVVAFVNEETDTTYKAELSSRWLSVDPLARKYPQLSPYVYCANNPIIYIDPDGRKIVDANGKEITYSPESGWSSNATVDVIRIGQAMMLTPVGTEVFDQLSSSNYNVTFNISSESGPNGNLGGMTPTYNKNGDIIKADIVVYEESVNNEVQNISNAKQTIDNNPNATVNTTEKGHALLNNLPTTEERIGQVAVHEGTHATNKQAQSKFNPDKSSRESIANSKELEAIKQTPEYRLKELKSMPTYVSTTK